MKKKVVILSNGLDGADRLARLLSEEGFIAYVQQSNEPLDSLPSIGPDVLLMGVAGPGTTDDARTLVGSMRREYGLRVIVLVDSLLPGIEDVALDADDFVLAPFRDAEVVARVKRASSTAPAQPGDGLSLGDLLIDTDGCQVLLNGESVELTFKEYELIKFLAQNPGKVFTREMLLNQVWGYDYYGGERTVDVHVRRLRSKLEVGGRTFIETVRGMGYMFKRLPDMSVAG